MNKKSNNIEDSGYNMESNEKIISEIRNLLQLLESSDENTKQINQNVLETLDDKTKEISREENKSIIILKIVFRALMVSVITFAFGFTIFTLLK